MCYVNTTACFKRLEHSACPRRSALTERRLRAQPRLADARPEPKPTTETQSSRRKTVFRRGLARSEVRRFLEKTVFLRALSVSVVIVSPAFQRPESSRPRKIQR